jgi:hypothetical protein
MFEALKNPVIFNRACMALAALWLLVGVPLTMKFRPPRFGDFGQFYMAAVMARQQAWGDLYPIPNPKSPHNPGLPEDSEMRPRYAELAEISGVGDEPRFISAPPVALMLWPLAWMEYERARWVWLFLNCGCALGVGLMAGKAYEILAREKSRIAGVMVLLVAGSHLMYTTLRALNNEPIIAVVLGASVMLILRQRWARSGAAMGVAALLKYVGAALVPVGFAVNRWRGVMWFLVWVAAACAVALVVIGPTPFVEYGKIFPLFSRPYDNDANQSVYGLLLRIGDGELGTGARILARIVSAGVLVVILVIMLRRPAKHYRENPALLFAASAAMLSWFLIFSPLTWNKYYIYLMPLWGWLAWEARQSRGRLFLAAAAMALSWASLMSHSSIELREPLTSHMLWAAVVVLSLAIARLRSAIGLTPSGHL